VLLTDKIPVSTQLIAVVAKHMFMTFFPSQNYKKSEDDRQKACKLYDLMWDF
jgi:hypothetical protein